MVRIDFSPFYENSSSADIICEFCSGGSYRQFVQDCKSHYDKRLYSIANKLSKTPVVQARKKAKYHTRKWYSW